MNGTEWWRGKEAGSIPLNELGMVRQIGPSRRRARYSGRRLVRWRGRAVGADDLNYPALGKFPDGSLKVIPTSAYLTLNTAVGL